MAGRRAIFPGEIQVPLKYTHGFQTGLEAEGVRCAHYEFRILRVHLDEDNDVCQPTAKAPTTYSTAFEPSNSENSFKRLLR